MIALSHGPQARPLDLEADRVVLALVRDPGPGAGLRAVLSATAVLLSWLMLCRLEPETA